MLKVVEGIYKDGNVAVKVDELPDVEDTTTFVIFVRNDIKIDPIKLGSRLELALELMSNVVSKEEFEDKEPDYLFNDLRVLGETELKIERKPFSVRKSKFFSNPPEHLGRISASDLDEILAEEALGRGKWKKSS
jgi:hypothetical protein